MSRCARRPPSTFRAEMPIATYRMTATMPPKPWYRQLWPWLLMSMPAAAIVGGAVTFWLAATSNNALVVDDYYREGKAINLALARDRSAAQMGLAGELTRQRRRVSDPADQRGPRSRPARVRHPAAGPRDTRRARPHDRAGARGPGPLQRAAGAAARKRPLERRHRGPGPALAAGGHGDRFRLAAAPGRGRALIAMAQPRRIHHRPRSRGHARHPG